MRIPSGSAGQASPGTMLLQTAANMMINKDEPSEDIDTTLAETDAQVENEVDNEADAGTDT